MILQVVTSFQVVFAQAKLEIIFKVEHEETLEKSDGTCFGLVQIVTELNLDVFCW